MTRQRDSLRYPYLDVADTDTPGARTQLRTMKREILADQFPYRKQL
jgi:hypothetical protein